MDKLAKDCGLVIIAAGFLAFFLLGKGLFLVLIGLIPLLYGLGYLDFRSRGDSENYDWYVATYPQSISNGKVHCRKCGSGHIVLRTYPSSTMQAHVCSQCGTTLYTSRL